MPDLPPRLSETNFRLMRYGLGLAVPIGFSGYGIYSLVTQHSYAIWAMRGYGIRLVPVFSEQAMLMGAAYFGLALVLFGNCYAQYHEKMGYYYQWIVGPAALLAGGGVLWSSWIFLLGRS